MFRSSAFTAQYPQTHLSWHTNVLKILYVTSFAIFIISTALTVSGTLGHGNVRELSTKHHTDLTPARWGFMIWDIILFLQAVFVIYQALPLHHHFLEIYLHQMSLFLPLAWLCCSALLFSFVYEELWLAVAFTFGSVLFLLIAYIRLHRYPVRFLPLLFSSRHYFVTTFYWKRVYSPVLEEPLVVPQSETSLVLSEKMKGIANYFFVFVPVSLMFGWMCLALSIALSMAVDSFRTDVASILILSVLTLISLFFMFANVDIWIPLALIWGFVAIGKARTYDHVVGHSAWIFVGVLAVMVVVQLLVQGYWIAVAAKKKEPVREATTTYTYSSY